MSVSGFEYIDKSKHIQRHCLLAHMHWAVMFSGIPWRIEAFYPKVLDGLKRYPIHTVQCMKLLLSVFLGRLTLSSTIQKINMTLTFQTLLEKYQPNITQPFCWARLPFDYMNACLQKLIESLTQLSATLTQSSDLVCCQSWLRLSDVA